MGLPKKAAHRRELYSIDQQQPCVGLQMDELLKTAPEKRKALVTAVRKAAVARAL